ncbi:MAG: MFS transporter, partial [Bacteroidales bacterium]|nr:MFS transporter [Bacteroidales bacterium]
MKANKPALWVPTLYLAEGIPYTAVMILSLIFYKVEGLSNTDIALYTGWFYLPWLIKPLWSPVVEMLRTSKFWIVTCQILLGAALGAVGLTLPFDNWLNYTLILFWLAAFMSATHDIAADGFYIEALDDKQQAGWVGVRSTFYKIAMMLCQGGLVILAGILEKKYSVNVAWTITFAILGALMALFGVYHMFILPKTEKAAALESDTKNQIRYNVWEQIKTFCLKDNLLIVLGFLLLYR